MRVTIQFVLSKFAIAWMFALVTVNFNRVAILEFGISAIVIATMIGSIRSLVHFSRSLVG
jgi:hypothetical protein